MKLAVVRVRGIVGVNQRIEDTMKLLRLYKKNHCVVVEDSKAVRGMLNKIKDYSTFGEVDEKTVNELLEKRGRVVGNKPLTEAWTRKQAKMDIKQLAAKFFKGDIKLKDVPGLKPWFKLAPPRGGFEREGIKKAFSVGGVLGYRKDKISALIRRMI